MAKRVELTWNELFTFNKQKQSVDTLTRGHYNVTVTNANQINICYNKTIYRTDTSWQAQNTMVSSLPVLVTQIVLMMIVTRLILFLLKPLRQPRFIAETIAGVLMGPSLLGGFGIAIYMFPFEHSQMYETVSNLAVTYYVFLAGLEIDISSVKRMGRKPLSIAVAGIIIPFCIGAGLFYLPFETGKTSRTTIGPNLMSRFGSCIWAISLTVTSFSDLARILSDVKLLHTDIGRLALTSAIVNDLSAWFLLAVVIICSYGKKFYIAAISTIGFIAICWFAVRPAIVTWSMRKKKNGEKFSDTHVHFVLAGVLICGFISDACGGHSMVGGFVFGLILPPGEFAMKIMERTEEYVKGILMPTFYFTVGYRTNFLFLENRTRPYAIALIVCLASTAKIVSTYLVSLYYRMPAKDALALGALLNTKGPFAYVVINKGRGLQAINSIEMPILICSTLFMTFLVAPIFTFAKISSSKQRKHRSIQESNPDSELRLLTCVHSSRNTPGIIRILEISNATRKSAINVFALHLVELTGRASAMLIVHDMHRMTNDNLAHEKRDPDMIFNAFHKYTTGNDNVSVYPLTVVSPYSTMHEDIFNLAKDKRVSMILVPYHKIPTATYELQDDNPAIQQVNQNLLVNNSPCSIGILVDRGLGFMNMRSNSLMVDRGKVSLRLCVLFVSGPDNHEALSYAWRMVDRPGVTLTVVRFLQTEDGVEEINKRDENMSDILSESKIEKMYDDEFINEFRFRSMCDNSITYIEKQVNNGIELTQCVRTMYNDFDLYIVGRGEGVKSPLTMGMSEWGENPELGSIGQVLISIEFRSHTSFLVVQQSTPGDELTVMRSQYNSKFGQKKWASPVLNPEYEAYVNSTNKDHVN